MILSSSTLPPNAPTSTREIFSSQPVRLGKSKRQRIADCQACEKTEEISGKRLRDDGLENEGRISLYLSLLLYHLSWFDVP
jgi:hypothetical protein